MISTRVGPKASPRIGAAIGASIDELGDGIAPTTTTLTVTIADSVDPVITAVNFSYAVVVTNTGVVNATNVSAVIVLDASLAFVSAAGSGWVCNNVAGTVTCTRATLAVGAAPTITITVTSGASALTASTSSNADADNTDPATQDIETTAIKLVSKDATSGIRCPASSTEWADFNAYHVAIGTSNFPNVAPSSLWLCQEASGNLADSIGANTLTANAAPAYQQGVGGWTRKAVAFTADTAGQRFSAVLAGFAPATHSTLWLAYLAVSGIPLGTRRVIAIGDGGTAGYVEHQIVTGNIALHVGSNVAASASSYSGAGVKPFAAKHNRTGSAQVLYTDIDKLVPTFAALTGTVQGIGATSGSSTGQSTIYMSAFVDTAAELSDAQVKALLQALGWTITWS